MGKALAQAWPRPSAPRPIVVIDAGTIVSDAHLPACRLAELPVAGVFDLDADKARGVAERFGVPAYATLDEALAVRDAVFDLALPPSAHLRVLNRLPEGGTALLQKPMGTDLSEATAILQVARERRLVAAVMHSNVATPWSLWPFLEGMKRVEIAVHSIHYLDLMRHFLGEPAGVHAKTLGHPMSNVAQTRTSAILDYGDTVRAVMSINHNHDFGRRFQDCSFRLEGTKGAAVARLGVNLDYPRGEPDELWICENGGEWESVPLEGAWFPHAFIGTMSNLQRFAAGEDARLLTSVEDAFRTMALVEACFASSAGPATPIAPPPAA